MRSYVEAYDHRDFATTEAIYPSEQSGFSRWRAMGTMRDLRTPEAGSPQDDRSGMFPEAGHSYYGAEVTVDARPVASS